MTNDEMVEAVNACLETLKILLGDDMTQGFVCIESQEIGNCIIASTMTRHETYKSLMAFAQAHAQDGYDVERYE